MAETKTGRRGYFRQLGRRLEEGADELMKNWKAQARRPDQVGDITYRGLELVHGGLGAAARSLTRLERATQLPHRTVKPVPPAVEAHAGRPAHQAPVRHGRRPERHEPDPSTS